MATGGPIKLALSKPARVSYLFITATLVLAGCLHMATPLLGALFGYFALTSRRIPVHRAPLYVALFFLSGLSALVGHLAFLAGPSLYFLFILFSPDFVQDLPRAEPIDLFGDGIVGDDSLDPRHAAHRKISRSVFGGSRSAVRGKRSRRRTAIGRQSVSSEPTQYRRNDSAASNVDPPPPKGSMTTSRGLVATTFRGRHGGGSASRSRGRSCRRTGR